MPPCLTAAFAAHANPMALHRIALPCRDAMMQHTTLHINVRMHTGHMVKIVGAVLKKQKTLFEGQYWSLRSVRFHRRSEHQINKKTFPLEMQLVHSNSKGKILIVAVLFRLGRFGNPYLNRLKWPKRKGATKAISKPFALQHLMPASSKYYAYKGSLTTPPCTEGVQWVVMVGQSVVSRAALDSFPYRSNARPLQPLNGRKVSFLSSEMIRGSWGYKGARGPSAWPKIFGAAKGNGRCDGRAQSPIDINSKKGGVTRRYQNKLQVHYNFGSRLTVSNDGHSIAVRGLALKNDFVVFEGKRFYLKQFSFKSKSETRIDGKQFALEAQLVNIDRMGSTLILSVLFNIGKANTYLNKLDWKTLPVHVFAHMPACMSMHVSVHTFVHKSAQMPLHTCMHVWIHLPIHRQGPAASASCGRRLRRRVFCHQTGSTSLTWAHSRRRPVSRVCGGWCLRHRSRCQRNSSTSLSSTETSDRRSPSTAGRFRSCQAPRRSHDQNRPRTTSDTRTSTVISSILICMSHVETHVYDDMYVGRLGLINGWKAYGHGYQQPTITTQGPLCSISGLIKRRGMARVLTSLPPKCRPNKRLIFNLNNHQGTLRVDVQRNGQVRYVAGTYRHNWLNLDGIVFATKNRRRVGGQNGWRNYGGAYGSVTYTLSGSVCEVEGLMKGGRWGQQMFTLPSSCRPPKRLIFNLNNHAKTARVDVLPNGQVVWVAGGRNHGWLSLAGILFAKKGGKSLRLANRWANYNGSYKTATVTESGGFAS